jgi:hypothetical protein
MKTLVYKSWSGNREVALFEETKAGHLKYIGLWESAGEYIQLKHPGKCTVIEMDKWIESKLKWIAGLGWVEKDWKPRT